MEEERGRESEVKPLEREPEKRWSSETETEEQRKEKGEKMRMRGRQTDVSMRHNDAYGAQ